MTAERRREGKRHRTFWVCDWCGAREEARYGRGGARLPAQWASVIARSPREESNGADGRGPQHRNRFIEWTGHSCADCQGWIPGGPLVGLRLS